MKRSLLVAAACLATAVSVPALAADVGVSVTIGQPGFYGHIEIGDAYPAPAVIYPQPVIIHPVPVGVVAQPVYLRVPPGQYKHWNKYCSRYNACGRPVYFVKDSWYNDVYAPRYRERHERGGYDRDRGDYDRDHGGDRRGWDDHDRGPGNSHGNGRGHGHGHGRD